jgi:thioredoxin-related protein
MKNITIGLLLIWLFGCKETPAVKTGLEGKEMPAFNMLLMDSSSQLNTSSIPTGQPTIFFLFEPGCPYCRALTQEIIADTKLRAIHFYLLSPNAYSQIKQYYDEYQLKKYPNLTVGQDYQSYLMNYFKAPGVPYLAIYGKDKRLKQVIIGKVGTTEIGDISQK